MFILEVYSMSKFCVNCGAQLDDAAEFCKECGAKQSVSAANANAEANTTPAAPGNDGSPIGAMGEKLSSMSSEQKKKIGIISAIVAAAVILIIVAVTVIVSLTKYQKIDCKELYFVAYDGINGQATAQVYLATPENIYSDPSFDSKFRESKYYEDYDYDGFVNSLASKWLLSKDDKDFKDAWTKFDSKKDIEKAQSKLIDEIEFKVDKKEVENLKNGDTFKVKVKYDEEKLKKRNIKLTNTEFTVTVEGLVEPTVLDPLSNVTVKFTGVDGMGEMELDTSALTDIESDAFYVYSDWYYDELSNGDVVTVTAEPYYSLSGGYFTIDGEYYTYDEDSLTKEFTVEGLTGLEVLDPFEGFELKYSGVAPDLDVSANTENCPDVVQDYVYFEIDNRYGLDIGDTVTVTASVGWYAEELAEEGYKLASDEVTKKFTIGDEAPHYINDIKDAKSLDVDTVFESLLEDIDDSVGSEYLANAHVIDYGKGQISKINSVTVGESYLVAPSEVASSSNVLYQFLVVEAACDIDGASTTKTFYVLAMADSAYVADGELNIDDWVIEIAVSENKDELLSQYVNTESNTAEGKTLTTTSFGKAASSDSSSKTDDSSSKADDSSSKADDSSSKAA